MSKCGTTKCGWTVPSSATTNTSAAVQAGRRPSPPVPSGPHARMEFEDAEDLLALLTVGHRGRELRQAGLPVWLASEEALSLLESEGAERSLETPGDVHTFSPSRLRPQYPDLRCVMMSSAPIQPPLLRPISSGALVPFAGRDDPSRPRPVKCRAGGTTTPTDWRTKWSWPTGWFSHARPTPSSVDTATYEVPALSKVKASLKATPPPLDTTPSATSGLWPTKTGASKGRRMGRDNIPTCASPKSRGRDHAVAVEGDFAYLASAVGVLVSI